jgi:hypothetical protein
VKGARLSLSLAAAEPSRGERMLSECGAVVVVVVLLLLLLHVADLSVVLSRFASRPSHTNLRMAVTTNADGGAPALTPFP